MQGRLTPAAVAAVRSALAVVLADVDPPAPWRPPPDVPDADLVVAVVRHRVATHLARGAARLDLPPAVAVEIIALDRTERMNSLRLVHDLCRASEALTAAGLRHLTFKGAALAQQVYGDPAARGFGDVDLLVARADVDVAHAALVGAGWQADPSWPRPDGSWVWRTVLAHFYCVPLLGPVGVDLQWRLHPTDWSPASFERAWARRVEVPVAGRSIPTLGLYDALVHSAGHAARDDWGWMRSLADVHQLAARRDTWLEADRPLGDDELASLGLAVDWLGRPAAAPPVVDEAVRVADRWRRTAEAHQAEDVGDATDPYLPVLGWLAMAGRLLRGSSDRHQVADVLWGLVVRPDRLGGIDHPTMAGALPVVVGNRLRHVRRQLRLYRDAERVGRIKSCGRG